VTPYWIDHHPEMRKGVVDFLSTKEDQFWKDLIDKYLYVLVKDAEASVLPRCFSVALKLPPYFLLEHQTYVEYGLK
jgi:hypothetical protein